MSMTSKRNRAILLASYLLLNAVIWLITGWTIEEKIGTENFALISQTLVYGGAASLLLGVGLLTGLVTK